MENKYFEFRTQEEKEKIENKLKKEGYVLPNNAEISFQEVKNTYKRNKVFLVRAYYNSINKKYEYVFTTKQIEKTYPTIENIKIIKEVI